MHRRASYFLGSHRSSSPPVSVRAHRVRDLDEARHVRTSEQARHHTVLRLLITRPLQTCVQTNFVAARHDVLQLLVNLLRRPLQTMAVLCHLQTRDRHTTNVRSLCSKRSSRQSSE